MTDLADIPAALESVSNSYVRDFVSEWAQHTGAARVELVGPQDEERLIEEAIAANELKPVTGGRYFSRSFSKDTARSEDRTFVATSDEADRGVFNNWRRTSEIKPVVKALMKGASAGKTMYVVPYLMAPPGSPLDAWAAGVELTDSRTVVLHMLRMARVGAEYVNDLAEPQTFVRGVHVTGDLASLEQGTPNDKRHFVTIADERLLQHYGSSYGGNALLGKIAHGLRLACYDGYKHGFLAEQFMLIGIEDKKERRTYHLAGGFPSASGKTNLAMMVPPAALADRYKVHFLGDDIAWMWVDERDGRLYAINPEAGVFGVAKDTNAHTNPNAMASVAPGSGAIFTNVAYHPETQDVWWEGLTPEHPADVSGWLDWRGEPISDRPVEKQRSKEAGDEWSHPNSRFTTTLANVPNLSPEASSPRGVPVDAIIFGGRVREREPLIRGIRDVAEAVYDGLTLGAEATAAADNVAGQMRYDPMSMRPFLAYSEGRYAQHWLDIMAQVKDKPAFAHVNWFQRDASGRYLWPGYGENLRALLWLFDWRAGRVEGRETAIGVLPRSGELNLEGVSVDSGDVERLFGFDIGQWREEMKSREAYLAQFRGLPEAIWAAHRELAARLDAARG